MKKIKYLFFLLLFLFSASVCAKQPVTDLLGQLRQAYSQVNSFTATMRLERFVPDYALQVQQVWFKRPQFIKLKQLGPFKKKAELAIKPDGSIRGHLGGWLSFAVVSLDKNDQNLFGVTNDSAFNTDFDAILDIAFDLSMRMTSYEISETEKNRVVLDTFYNDQIDHYRLVIDKERMLITALERYSKQKLVHRIVWSNIKLNIEIPESEFDL